MLISSILILIVLLLISSGSASLSGLLISIGLVESDFGAFVIGMVLVIIAFASYGHMMSIANYLP